MLSSPLPLWERVLSRVAAKRVRGQWRGTWKVRPLQAAPKRSRFGFAQASTRLAALATLSHKGRGERKKGLFENRI
jgi:hypothetical protein